MAISWSLMSQGSAVWVAVGEPEFPARLEACVPAPAGVWVDGALPDKPMLAIVGARAAVARSLEAAAAAARAAVELGWVVVSGGAFGVDAAAHQAALDAGGETVAVLGCGVDICYPQRHRPLFARIRQRGALLSSLPLGAPPRQFHFPARNQLIAALAHSVLVVEASLRSGSLSTAAHARRLGRRRLAIPGSPGTNRLLVEGATALPDPAALADVLSGTRSRPSLSISDRAAELHLTLKVQPATLPELVDRTLLSVGECAELLFELESCGKACRIPNGLYQARD